MRLFVSIEFPPEIIAYLTQLQHQLFAQKLFEGTLTKPEQLHLTLQFIGDVSEKQVPEIQRALRSISMKPFQASLGSLGVFSSQNHIRIVWIDIQAKELVNLVQNVNIVLEPKVVLEEREFVNHITLARVKKVPDKATLISYLKSIKPKPICFMVNNFILKQSILTSQGAEYSDVERYVLE